MTHSLGYLLLGHKCWPEILDGQRLVGDTHRHQVQPYKGNIMPQTKISIRTADGECPAYVLTPEGTGPWPAAIFYMDRLAMRPALVEMAQRLADGGYVVLLPDLHYRIGPYEPLDLKAVFATKDVRAAIAHLLDSTDNRRAAADTAAFLEYLDTRKDIAGTKVGTTGYCMGGGISLTVAGTYPERISAAASFHGGALATDSELSPHRLAPEIKGRVYVAGAENDEVYPPEQAHRLEQALTDAGVDHLCEIYAGAAHGWTMTDLPAYNEAAAERHWQNLFKLFEETLH
jgi:carboxymethylenebutenolidase